jgi:hypothetical protein
MSIRYIIAAALMASACVAQADVLPGSPALDNASLLGSVSRSAESDALVQALYDKVSASVGSDMKVSLKQGIDGVYVTGLSTAKAVALAGDGMSVISTADGYKIVQGVTGTADATTGGGAATSLGIQAVAAANVPEPSTVALMLAGVLGVAGLRRRSR